VASKLSLFLAELKRRKVTRVVGGGKVETLVWWWAISPRRLVAGSIEGSVRRTHGWTAI